VNRQGDDREMTTLARGGALNLVGAACAGLMGIGLVLAVAHAYDQEFAGSFFAAVSLFLILLSVAGLGTDAGVVRWLSRSLALGDPRSARRAVLVALVPVVGVASVAGVAVTFGASGLAALIGADRPDQVEAMLRIMAVFLPVAAAHDLLLAATRGHGVMRPTVLIEKILRQTVQVGGVLVVAQVFGADGAALALAWALPYLPGMVLAGLWYRRLVGRAAATPSP
jgi:O-antigen/teichoic acid export membrane protein